MWDDIHFSARDGVRLYARKYSGKSGKRALLCLPGLVGNCQEFDVLAEALSGSNPSVSRTVYTIDCRGRGRSELGGGRDAPSLLAECEDVLELMTLAGLQDAAVLGTGHGGQLALILALLRPSAVGALILNESAPEFEPEGVVRQMGEIAALPLPATWAEAASLLKGLQGRRYPGLDDAQWLGLAKSRFREVAGQPARSYHSAIAASHSFSRGHANRRSLWPQFAAMAQVPMLLLRAELSDMIGDPALARMRDLHPALEVANVAGQGHPVLLRDPASIGLVAQFLSRNDRIDPRAETSLRAVA